MTTTIFNASLAGHALLGHLLEVPDHDPGDVDEEGRPCLHCVHCGRPRLEGLRYCDECARFLRLRRLGVPAAAIIGLVDRYCNYGADTVRSRRLPGGARGPGACSPIRLGAAPIRAKLRGIGLM